MLLMNTLFSLSIWPLLYAFVGVRPFVFGGSDHVAGIFFNMGASSVDARFCLPL